MKGIKYSKQDCYKAMRTREPTWHPDAGTESLSGMLKSVFPLSKNTREAMIDR